MNILENDNIYQLIDNRNDLGNWDKKANIININGISYHEVIGNKTYIELKIKCRDLKPNTKYTLLYHMVKNQTEGRDGFRIVVSKGNSALCRDEWAFSYEGVKAVLVETVEDLEDKYIKMMMLNNQNNNHCVIIRTALVEGDLTSLSTNTLLGIIRNAEYGNFEIFPKDALKYMSYDLIENMIQINVKNSNDYKLICHYSDGNKFSYNSIKKSKSDIYTYHINIEEFSLQELDAIYFEKNSEIIEDADLITDFTKLKLKTDSLTSLDYLVNNVFNPQARYGLNNKEVFLKMYSILQYMSKHNIYNNFGKIISVLCFRISDDFRNLKIYIDDAYKFWIKCECNLNENDGMMLRDFVSGSTTLTVLLLSIGDISRSKDIISKVNSAIIHTGVNVFNYYNYSLLMILKGLIAAYEENFEEATASFLYSFNIGRNGIVEMIMQHCNDILDYKVDIEWTEKQVFFDAMVLYYLRKERTMLGPAGVNIRHIPSHCSDDFGVKKINELLFRFHNIHEETPEILVVAIENIIKYSNNN